MGHMGNGNTWGSRVQGYVIVGISHMGNGGTWGNRVQGYGQ